MITIIMPKNPDHYYGSSVNSYDLKVGDEVYFGPSPITTSRIIKQIHSEPTGFTVITDDYKLLVPFESRVSLKPSWSKA